MNNRFMSHKKVGGMHVWRIGRFTIMACARTVTPEAKLQAAILKRAKRRHRDWLARTGAKYLWHYEGVNAYSPEPNGAGEYVQ